MTGTAAQLITWLLAAMGDDKEKLYDLKAHKAKRTRSQNAYYWELLSQTADKLRMSKAELHNRMLRQYGRPEIYDGRTARLLLPDTEATEEKTLRSETVHLKPSSQVTTLADGVTYRTYVLLKGSHDMNTAEMSALVDGMIQEAKAQGVETMPPHELEELRKYEFQKQTKQGDRHPETGKGGGMGP